MARNTLPLIPYVRVAPSRGRCFGQDAVDSICQLNCRLVLGVLDIYRQWDKPIPKLLKGALPRQKTCETVGDLDFKRFVHEDSSYQSNGKGATRRHGETARTGQWADGG